METRTLAAAIALIFLLGLGVGWQLMPRQQQAIMLTETTTRIVTITLAGATVERVVTSTIYVAAGAATSTVTVTALPPALPKILLPTASLDCGEEGNYLRISFIVANAGSGTILVNVSGITHRLRGVKEVERFSSPYIPPGLAEVGAQEAHIVLSFVVTDPGALKQLIKPQPEGFAVMLLMAEMRVPYLWEGGSGELELESLPLTLPEGCGLPNK